MTTRTTKAERKIALPMRHPELTMTSASSQVMVTLSPPVSPKVVARTLMIQKPSVTAGTLLAVAESFSNSAPEDQEQPKKHQRKNLCKCATLAIFIVRRERRY